MANKLAITITAIDRATAVVAKINRSLGKLTRPIADVKSAVGGFSKEAGLDRIGKGFVGVAHAAGNVAEKVGSIVAPLAAVVGVGSIAGVAALANEWAHLGAEVGRTSVALGQSTDDVQLWRGVARLSGVSAAALTSSMKSLGDTMQDAVAGRNQEALSLMERLGISLHRTRTGAVDTGRAMRDLSGVMERTAGKPQVQSLIARTFGVEESLPMLRKGRRELAALQEEVRRTGAVMSPAGIASATAFSHALEVTALAGMGLKNAIGEKLLPLLTPLIDRFNDWIVANKEIIATKVTTFVIDFANAIASVDWVAFGQGAANVVGSIGTVVDMLGGAKGAAIALGVVMAGPLIASLVSLGTAFAALTGIMLANPVGAALVLGGAAIVGASLYAKAHQPAGMDTTTPRERAEASGRRVGVVRLPGAPMAARGAPVAPLTAGGAPVSPIFLNGGAAAGQSGSVKVDVDFTNAPAGMRATVSTSGAVDASARVDSAMPEGSLP